MRQINAGMLGVILLVGLSVSLGHAAFGVGDIVFDPTNYVENAVTAFNTFETVQNTVTMIENQIEDLKTLETLPAVAQVVWRLARIMKLLYQFEHLIPFDPDRARAMFDVLYPSAPPCTQQTLVIWEQETRLQVRVGLKDSQYADGLISQLTSLGDVFQLTNQLMTVLGSVRGLQLSAQLEAFMVPLQALLPILNGTFHRALTNRDAFELTRVSSLDCIRRDIREDLPHRNVFGLVP